MVFFINGVKATYQDLLALYRNVRNKKDGLRDVFTCENETHFITV